LSVLSMAEERQAEAERYRLEEQAPGEVVRSLVEALGAPELVARILAGRGIRDPEEARRFLYPRIDDLSDPFLLPDMERGVERMIQAVTKRQVVGLYGDYDADGVTSLALMVSFLRQVNVNPVVYIPDRKEGYGLNTGAVKRLKEQGVELLVCLDCGSTNVEEIDAARTLAMDTVILDHHEPPPVSPEAYALINPKRTDSRFPTRELAACGVTFFFLLALRRVMTQRGLLHGTVNLKRELDVVTVGTVGDMVPLSGDNRIIVKFGMEMMNKAPRQWLQAFFKHGLIHRRSIDEYSLNFIVIPRINAAGRVSGAEKALRFLLSHDGQTASSALLELEQANKKRQQIEEDTLKATAEIIRRDNLGDRSSLVLFGEDWHIGVIGIVAQKLMELHGKPSVVLTRVDDVWKGSGRGGDGLDLYHTVSSLSHLLVRYGGHRYACGVTLFEENLIPFRDAFEQSVRGTADRGTDKRKRVRADTEAAFEELTGDFLTFLGCLSPFGMGNPRPNLLLSPDRVTVNNRSLKITDRNNRIWHGSFQGQPQPSDGGGEIQIIASPAVRQDIGEQFIHLYVKEIMRGKGE
jgi:single-stranded-DNA-specific exonuclease